MNDRTRRLLLLVAALAALRFIAVPWIDSQGAQRVRLEALTLQLDRAEALVEAGSDAATREAAVEDALARALQQVPVANSPDGHRLEIQRQLREAAGSAELSVFDWVLDAPESAADVRRGRVQVQLEGTVRDLARAHGAIEGGMPHVIVREARLSVRRPAQGDASPGGLTLVLDVLSRPGGEQP